MDLLSRLPAELRQLILCLLATRQDVANLASTSRTWFRQAKASKINILHYLYDELPGHLLQDAAAILTFPSKHPSKLAAEAHSTGWGCKQLPDPLSHSSTSSVLALDLLYQTIVSYINDYLSKASCPDLRTSYLRLPSWAHPPYLDESTEQIPKNSVTLSLLSVSPGERSRLLQAFLRYGLICRAYKPYHLHTRDLNETPNPSLDDEMAWADSYTGLSDFFGTLSREGGTGSRYLPFKESHPPCPGSKRCSIVFTNMLFLCTWLFALGMPASSGVNFTRSVASNAVPKTYISTLIL
jgi:hypothetical protein